MRFLLCAALFLALMASCGDDDDSPTPTASGTPAVSSTPVVCPASGSPGYELAAPAADSTAGTPVEFTVSVGDEVPEFVRVVNRLDPSLIYGFFEVDPATPPDSEVTGEIPISVVGRRDACVVAYTLTDLEEGAPESEASVPIILEHEPRGAVCESNFSLPGKFVVRSPQPFAVVPPDIPVELLANVDGEASFDVLVTNVNGETIGEGEITPDGAGASGEIAAEEAGEACLTIFYRLPAGDSTAIARMSVLVES